MTAGKSGLDALPIDPTFHPKTYERLARLLEVGVLIFFSLMIVGFVDALNKDWSMTIKVAIKSSPKPVYWTPPQYFSHLFSFDPQAVILLSVAAMMVTVITRSAVSAADLLRGGERILGTIAVTVILVIVTAFLVARYV